jgi:ribosomal protein S8
MQMALTYDENRVPVINQITDLKIKDGRMFVKIPGMRTKTEDLEVISYENGTLTLMEKNKNTIYNYIMKTNESDFMKSVQTIVGNN